MSMTGRTFALNQSLFSLGGDLWIEDEAGNHAFEVDGKAFTLRRTLELRDTAGTTLYTINRSLAHVRSTFEIKRNDEVVATIEEALLHLFGDRFTIHLAGGSQLTVQGDWIDRDFHITRGGADVILASRSLLSLHGGYGIQVAPDFDIPFAIAIVVALEQMELESHHR
jgi:uncharacterized protein YxjI